MKYMIGLTVALAMFVPSAACANGPGHVDEMPALRFGAMSDVHIRKSRPQNADLPGTCLFLRSELPTDRTIRFTVTPRDCFGGAGQRISCMQPCIRSVGQ